MYTYCTTSADARRSRSTQSLQRRNCCRVMTRVPARTPCWLRRANNCSMLLVLYVEMWPSNGHFSSCKKRSLPERYSVHVRGSNTRCDHSNDRAWRSDGGIGDADRRAPKTAAERNEGNQLQDKRSGGLRVSSKQVITRNACGGGEATVCGPLSHAPFAAPRREGCQ